LSNKITCLFINHIVYYERNWMKGTQQANNRRQIGKIVYVQCSQRKKNYDIKFIEKVVKKLGCCNAVYSSSYY